VIDILPNGIFVDNRGFTYAINPATGALALVNVPSLNNIWSGGQSNIVYADMNYTPTLPVNTGVDTIIIDPSALQEYVPLPQGYFYDPSTGYFMQKNVGGDYIAIDAQEIFG